MRRGSSLLSVLASTAVLLFSVSHSLPGFAQIPAQSACEVPAAARISSSIDENARTSLEGNVHPLARSEFDRGSVDDSLPMEHIIMVLQRSPEQELALTTRIDQMHNHNSPLFHQWLGADQTGVCYGVADEDLATVSGWLESHGFKIDKIPAGKMLIIFSGTAGQVRETFHTEIHKLDVHGEKHIANMSPPQIPEALAPVIAGIRSLHNFFPKSLLHPARPTKLEAQAAAPHDLAAVGKANEPNQYSLTELGGAQALYNIILSNGTEWFVVGPQDLYTIYNEKPLLTAATPINGAGQTLAVVEPTDIKTADVSTFRAQFGLPPYPATPNATQGGVKYMFGISGFCNDPGIVSGTEGEADLDVEWVGTTAPNAIVDFVACESSSTTSGLELASTYAVNDLASTVSAISVSYGECESQLGSSGQAFFKNLWQQAAAEGQTVVVAAGDSGDDVCDRGDASGVGATGLSVSGLASTPYNVAAGGTDFTDTYSGDILTYWYANNTSPFQSVTSYVPEKGWNNSCGSNVIANDLGGTPEQVCNDLLYASLDGGTGGVSTIYSLPTWQSVYGVGLSSNFTSTSYRNMPDIAMFASGPVVWRHGLVLCDSDHAPCSYRTPPDTGASASTAGGTSFVAPIFTGIIGLINQAHPSGSPAHPTRQGQANYTLYALAAAEYGTASTRNVSTTKPSVYTCESNRLAISTYSGVFPDCIFHDINRTPVTGTSTCVGSSNTNCIVENNDQPCVTGTPDCFTATSGHVYGLLSLSTTRFETAYPQSAGYNAVGGLGSVNITNLVRNWDTVTPQFASFTTVVANPSTIGAASTTTLTATVTATGRGGIAPPMGTVSFYTGASCTGTALGTSALVSAAHCTTSCHATASLAGVTGTQLGGDGTRSATACFSGDGANDAPSHGTATVIVGKDASVTTLASSLNPSLAGQSVTFTATITPAGPPTPTGTVSFTSNGTAMSGCSAVALTSGRIARCITSFPTIATYAIKATYSGDANYLASTSATLSQNVKAASTTTLVSSLNPSTAGKSVTFTATITPAGPPTPTGTVAFSSNGTAIAGCSAVAVLSSRKAACTTTALAVGTDSIKAVYSGDGNYVTSTSAALSQVVNKAASTTILVSSLNPSTAGKSVTFTATITPSGPPTPTGTVSFSSNGTAISGCGGVVLSSLRTAVCVTSLLAVGTDSIKAVYSGNGNYVTSSSAALSQVVNKTASATTLASSLNPSTAGQSVTFTATITPTGPPTPTGTVSFSSNGTAISGCSAVALTSGRTAACTTSFPTIANYAVKATHSGDTNYLTSTSATLSQVVKAASTTTLVSSLNPSTAGKSVTFTATITPAGPPTPTGTVSFSSNGTAISGCSAITLTSSRTAACATTALAVGTDSIKAVYSGDGNYVTSTSAALSQVVYKAASTTTLVSSLNPSTAGESVTFTATITPAGPPTPTGTVSFSSNGTAISGCSAVTVLTSRTAACMTSSLSVGTDSIKAVYSGNGNYVTSSSAALSQVVNKTASATALASSLNPSIAGQSVTFTATITPAGPPTPTGTVSFSSNGTAISGCSAVTVLTSRTAACVTSSLAVGTDSIKAVYSGDANHLTSSSATLSQVVNNLASTTTLVSNVNPFNLARVCDLHGND